MKNLNAYRNYGSFRNTRGTVHMINKLVLDEAENYQLIAMNQRDFNADRLRSGVGFNIEQSPSLVLNADYTPLSHLPLSLWCWQDTLKAVFSGKAIVVSEYSDLFIRSVSCCFPLPSVIALKTYQRAPTVIPVMSRRNVYIRDGFKCQYCCESFPLKELSLDHVIPKSKGGKLAWTNTVTACLACNYKKGQKELTELPKIGMRLRMMPRAPTNSELQYKAKSFKKSFLHPDWTVYV